MHKLRDRLLENRTLHAGDARDARFRERSNKFPHGMQVEAIYETAKIQQFWELHDLVKRDRYLLMAVFIATSKC